jgi:hypothetical protein
MHKGILNVTSGHVTILVLSMNVGIRSASVSAFWLELWVLSATQQADGLVIVQLVLLEDVSKCIVGRLSNKTKQTPWPLVRERTIPTDRPPLVDEI